MNNRYFLFSLLFVGFIASAMEQEMVFTIYFRDKPVYVGNSQTKDYLEQIYDKQFSLDTVFFRIGYIEATIDPSDEYRDELEKMPDLIPYDYIKDKKEGELIKLTIAGKERTIVCKHGGQGMKFHDMMLSFLEGFKNRANWLSEADRDKAETSLVDAEVIDRKNYYVGGSGHGKNCSEYVK